jgi:hypothetical protein
VWIWKQPQPQRKKMMNDAMLPVVVSQCRALVPIEDYAQDFEDRIDDTLIVAIQRESIRAQDELEASRRKIGVTVHSCAMRHPHIAAMLRSKLNTLRELRGQAAVEEGRDPMTGAPTQQKEITQEDLVAQIQAQAKEQEAQKELWKNLGPNTQKRLKRLMRTISKLCHPDTTKDPNLHDVFKISKRIFDVGDIDTLEQINRDVANYVYLKRDKHKFRDFKRQTIKNLKGQRSAILSQLQQIQSSLEWGCVRALESGQDTEQAYLTLALAQMQNLDREIRKISEQQFRTTVVQATASGFRFYGNGSSGTSF